VRCPPAVGEVPYYTAPHTNPHTTPHLNKNREALRQRKLRRLVFVNKVPPAPRATTASNARACAVHPGGSGAMEPGAETKEALASVAAGLILPPIPFEEALQPLLDEIETALPPAATHVATMLPPWQNSHDRRSDGAVRGFLPSQRGISTRRGSSERRCPREGARWHMCGGNSQRSPRPGRAPS
jgi:hypothetical protein